MRIQLCIAKNDGLNKKFPKDPDFDFIIRCNQSVFKLQIAFLYLQSNFFDKIDQKQIKELDLNEFDQDALRDVLSILYGGELTVKSFEHLSRIYEVVNHLQIESLKQSIVSQLQDQLTSLNPLELLEFSFKTKILNIEVSQMILQNDLEMLSDPMFSMELNKVSAKNLNIILLQYYTQCNGPKREQSKVIISGILSDYFHINKIKPQEYFDEHKVDILKSIWFENHPIFIAETLYESQVLQEESELKISHLMEEVKQLEEMISKYDQRILKLQQENALLKERELYNSLNFKTEEDETRIQKINSPFKMEVGQEEPYKIPSNNYFEVPEDENLSFGRRINPSTGPKFLQNVKEKNRNNSNAKK